MPLRLNVGVTRKLGLPEYSSVGAACYLEVELDAGLLDDLETFHERVRDAYVACHQAVQDELARLRGLSAPPAVGPTHGPAPHANGTAAGGSAAPGRPRKPATPSQVRAVVALARRRGTDLHGLLRDEYGLDRPEDLALPQASALIDRLKATADR